MPPSVVVLVLFAALLHAGWNILLKTAADPLRTAARGVIIGAVVLVPAGVIGWLLADRPALPAEVWFLAGLSGIVEAVYFVLLSAAYRRGDLSLVYPIARGTAPIVAVAVGIVILNERLSVGATAGVACLLGGIIAIQRPWELLRRGPGHSRRTRDARLLAMATGVAIASYSAIDLTGVRLVPPWLYAPILWGAQSIFLGGWILVLDRWGDRRLPAGGRRLDGRRVTAGDPLGATRPSGAPDRASVEAVGWLRPGLGGLATVAAYFLILVAYVSAPLSAVAPLRESAIVMASGWGIVRLGEVGGRRAAVARLGAAAVIVAGAVFLAVAR